MDGNDIAHDPLCLNLKRQTQKLLNQLPAGSSYAAALNAASSRPALLNLLSALLYTPQLTDIIASLFRPILLDLCARWLEQDTSLLEKFEALCSLLEIHPELYPYVYSPFCVSPERILHHYVLGSRDAHRQYYQDSCYALAHACVP